MIWTGDDDRASRSVYRYLVVKASMALLKYLSPCILEYMSEWDIKGWSSWTASPYDWQIRGPLKNRQQQGYGYIIAKRSSTLIIVIW